ncbi:MAG: hypothetical protein JWR61_4552 [Ferruginibacter sp.]|nr:hypothetical protein [Ferruginibacter sp.]
MAPFKNIPGYRSTAFNCSVTYLSFQFSPLAFWVAAAKLVLSVVSFKIFRTVELNLQWFTSVALCFPFGVTRIR